MRRSGWKMMAVVWISAMFCAGSAQAVILFSKSDRNTRPPHGSLVNSGWQWQGQFGSFLGTPIAQQYFMLRQQSPAPPPDT